MFIFCICQTVSGCWPFQTGDAAAPAEPLFPTAMSLMEFEQAQQGA